ncbi:MAG: hypothetical protein JNK75_14535 [Betaproteobacteria bacterium]|nr:hypothetical protein [Betaproteobacteria bacterium]
MNPVAWPVAARVVFVVTLTVLGIAGARAGVPNLPAATNLAADARIAAQQRLPLVVLVSLEGCGHCDTIRASHLLPLQRSKPAAAVIRQVELTSTAPLIGFDGRRTTHAEFARAQGARVAPVVLFFDAKGGRAAEPLVGASIADFYGAYLDKGLADARAALRAP